MDIQLEKEICDILIVGAFWLVAGGSILSLIGYIIQKAKGE